MSQETLTRLKQMALELDPGEQLELLEGLARSLRRNGKTSRNRKSLFGAWKGKFPEDFDVDKTLGEIRSEWEEEMNEL